MTEHSELEDETMVTLPACAPKTFPRDPEWWRIVASRPGFDVKHWQATGEVTFEGDRPHLSLVASADEDET